MQRQMDIGTKIVQLWLALMGAFSVWIRQCCSETVHKLCCLTDLPGTVTEAASCKTVSEFNSTVVK